MSITPVDMDKMEKAAAAMQEARTLAGAAALELVEACGILAERARRVAELQALPQPFCEAARGLAASLENTAQTLTTALNRK